MRQIETDNSIRLKVTNQCQLSCSFCHNEGTELPENNRNRVSFQDNVLPSLSPLRDIPFDMDILNQISKVQSYGINEIHLTGGEPSLNVNITDIIAFFKERGFVVKMTSNGQFGTELLEEMKKAGLSSINFSILSLKPESFLKTQIYQSPKWAEKVIDNLSSSIMNAKKLGFPIKANTVISTSDDYINVDQILQFCNDANITLVLLNNVSLGRASDEAVSQYVLEKQGELISVKEPLNNSRGKRIYLLPNGKKIETKYFREYYPDIICRNCPNKGNACLEKYYGIRVELRDVLYARLCIQKSDRSTLIPLETFLNTHVLNAL